MDRDCDAPRNGDSKDEQRPLTRDNKFCNSSFLDSGKLFRILAQVIALNSAEFTRVYQDLTGSFEHASEFPLNDDFVSKPLSRIRRPLRPLRNAIYPGVDLPCWIEPPRTGRQTIILLGQDPRRDQGYFTVPARKQPYVVIGTPYSVHSRRMTQWHNNQRYWKIIQPLLDAGYNLYLTDIAKFWVRGQKTPPSGEARKIYKGILEKEIDLVAPSLVVSFGVPATTFLMGPSFFAGKRMRDTKAVMLPLPLGSTKVLPVLHPSPLTAPILPRYLRANGIPRGRDIAAIADIILRALTLEGSGALQSQAGAPSAEAETSA